MIKQVIIIGGVVLLLFSLADGTAGRVLAAFMLAGIIPGTSYQLPWYVTMLAAPLALIGLVKLFFAILAKDMARKIILLRTAELTKNNKSTKRRAPAKRSTYMRQARKSLKSNRANSRQANKLTQTEA